jgi:hypothetical protein
MSVVVFIALAFTIGVQMSNSGTMIDAQATARNVREITSNMIPVSKATASAALRNDTAKNSSLAEAGTEVLLGVAKTDFAALTGNATLMLRAIAKIDFSAVTKVFEQAVDADIQKILKTQFEHAISSFDFATHGIASIASTFISGLNPLNTTHRRLEL